MSLAKVLADLSQPREALASAERGLSLAKDDYDRSRALATIEWIRKRGTGN